MRRAWVRAAAAGVLCGALTGCSRPPSPTAAPAATASRIDRYVVVGEIVELPEPGRPDSGLRVDHEPIPDFRAPDGTIVGMAAMTMEFTPAAELDLGRLSVGDRVRMTWEVVDGGAEERVVAIAATDP